MENTNEHKPNEHKYFTTLHLLITDISHTLIIQTNYACVLIHTIVAYVFFSSSIFCYVRLHMFTDMHSVNSFLFFIPIIHGNNKTICVQAVSR